MPPRRSLYAVLWEFWVRNGQEKHFEKIYGPQGTWARFFGQGRGYRGTMLHRDVVKKDRYVTLDYWDSQTAYETFREQHRAEYKAIDRQCAALTIRETPLGSFLSVNPPRARRRARGGRE